MYLTYTEQDLPIHLLVTIHCDFSLLIFRVKKVTRENWEKSELKDPR